MFKYLRNRRSKSGVKKSKLTKDDFNLAKTVTHGFPRSPTCLAFDPKLSLLAIGAKDGSLRIYGKPGVELEATFQSKIGILLMCFVINKGQLVVLSDDYLLTLWEINVKQRSDGVEQSFLELVKSCNIFEKEEISNDLKQVSTLTVTSNNEKLMVGSKIGNIYMISLETFELTKEVILSTVVLQTIPNDFKKTSLGEVEVILEKPFEPHKLLIGYSRGILVLWDTVSASAENFYISDQELQSACWRVDGEQFVSSHNDGSYICWKVISCLDDSKHIEQPYGPYPCKSIPKIVTKKSKENDEYFIFSGGLLRHSFPDKSSVSIFKKGADDCINDQVLDFPSKVIDFLVIDLEKDEKATFDVPLALIVLTEEEIVAFDLTTPDWLQFPLPYLSGIHSSPIICSQHYSNIPEEIFSKVKEARVKQQANKYSSSEWPINGGQVVLKPFTQTNDLLITGHEDGSVRFWDVGDVDLKHIYTLKTQKLFASPDDDIIAIDSEDVPLSSDGKEEAWPPFRKVGNFDPYSDDPQLQIRKILFCVSSGTLIIGGAAGQVLIFKLGQEESEEKFPIKTIHIMNENDAANLKGFHKLNVKSANVKFPGFQKFALIQASPPSAVTALAFNFEWNLLAIGTSFGFGLYDLYQHREVLMKCTISSQESAAAASGDTLISRRKSFKKSLRESFRRLRRVRSQRTTKKAESGSSPSSGATPTSTPTKGLGERSKVQTPTKELSSSELKPIERRVEARITDDVSGAVVKTFHFGFACIDKKETAQTVTLWAGTQAGIVYALAFKVPNLGNKEGEEDLRKNEPVTYLSGREIRLAHKAPVVFICLIDAAGNPIPDPCEKKLDTNKPPATVDKVLICTEEQFILYSIPQLKHHSKFKLTADEGLRARKIALVPFSSKLDKNTSEYFIVCLSNYGDIEVFSLSDFEQKLKTALTKKEDIQAISSLVLTCSAEGFYLHSPSEFRRFSLSPLRIVESIYLINLPPDARPAEANESVHCQEEHSTTGAAATAALVATTTAVAAVATGSSGEEQNKKAEVEICDDKSVPSSIEVKSEEETDEKKETIVEKNLEKSKEKADKKLVQKMKEVNTLKNCEQTLNLTQEDQVDEVHNISNVELNNENLVNEGVKKNKTLTLLEETKNFKVSSMNGVTKEEMNESLEMSLDFDLSIDTTIDSVRDLTINNSLDKSDANKMISTTEETNPVLNSHGD